MRVLSQAAVVILLTGTAFVLGVRYGGLKSDHFGSPSAVTPRAATVQCMPVLSDSPSYPAPRVQAEVLASSAHYLETPYFMKWDKALKRFTFGGRPVRHAPGVIKSYYRTTNSTICGLGLSTVPCDYRFDVPDVITCPSNASKDHNMMRYGIEWDDSEEGFRFNEPVVPRFETFAFPLAVNH